MARRQPSGRWTFIQLLRVCVLVPPFSVLKCRPNFVRSTMDVMEETLGLRMETEVNMRMNAVT